MKWIKPWGPDIKLRHCNESKAPRNSLFCMKSNEGLQTLVSLVSSTAVMLCLRSKNRNRVFPPNDYRVSERRFTALSNIFLLNALNE